MKPLLSTSNFNIYLKRVIAFALALLTLYCAAEVMAYALEQNYDSRNSSQQVTACQLKDFYALEENSVDVLILGSSHAMCSYDPVRIEEEFNLRTFNLGTALQQPDTAYHLLKEVLKTQKPKFLIYDVYFKVMLDEYSNEQASTVLREMRFSKNALSHFWNDLDLTGKVDFYNNRINPFGRIQDIMENPTLRSHTPPAAYRGSGFYSSTNTIHPNELKEDVHPFSNEFYGFDARQTENLKMLIALAEENDIQVILASAPLPPTILGRVDYFDEIVAETNEIAAACNVPYYDMTSPSSEIVSDFDFADQGHLNRVGVSKFMDYFIDIIKKELSDNIA